MDYQCNNTPVWHLPFGSIKAVYMELNVTENINVHKRYVTFEL